MIPDMTEFFPNEINPPYGIERILLPFIMKKHDELKLEKSYPVSEVKPQMKLKKLLFKNNIISSQTESSESNMADLSLSIRWTPQYATNGFSRLNYVLQGYTLISGFLLLPPEGVLTWRF